MRDINHQWQKCSRIIFFEISLDLFSLPPFLTFFPSLPSLPFPSLPPSFLPSILLLLLYLSPVALAPLILGHGFQLRVFCPPGHIYQYLKTFSVVTIGEIAIGIRWVEIREAAMHRTPLTSPTVKDFLIQNVSGVEIEN